MVYPEYYELIADSLGISIGLAIFLLVVVGIWSLVWKGLALWKSSQRKSVVWFIVLLVVNTFGILEILYIFVFSELGKSKKKNENLKAKVVNKKIVKKKRKK